MNLVEVVGGRRALEDLQLVEGIEPRRRRVPLVLDAAERQEVLRLANRRAEEVRLVERSNILLLASDGYSDAQIADALGITRETVGKWRRLYPQRRDSNPEYTIAQRLADAARVGRPDTFDELFWIDVLKVATADPETYGLPITHWTVRELTDKVIELGLVPSIHFTTVAKFLRECTLQPHRVQEWLNRKQDPEFDERAQDVQQCLVKATTDPSPGEVVVSFDEKTGMQAKERIAPQQRMRPGQPARIEFEYARHGTLVLFGMMLVNSGLMLGCTRPNRTNPVTAAVLISFFTSLLQQGFHRIHVVLDQLNTHWSVELVEAVAQLCGLPSPGPEAIQTGTGRRAWLSAANKSIIFHFTPKHASWLNPIEIWFGVLARKVLRRGSFRCTEDLDARVQRFIDYYNEKLAHPYRFQTHRRAA